MSVLDNQPEIWDNTKLQAYACEYKGHLAMERHLVGNRESEALVFGTAFHKAVELWTKAKIEDYGRQADQAMEIGRQGFLEVWNRDLPEEMRFHLEQTGDRRSYANFCLLFEAFCRKFPIEMFDSILATETPFTLFLGKTPKGREVNWSGILDRAVIWQGATYYVDVKTSSYPLDDRFFSTFRLSGQMIGYTWAGHELGLGDFNGVMIQAVEVRIPQQGVKLKKDGTPYARQGRQLEDMVNVDIIPITEEKIERWKASTLRKVDQIIEARESGAYTRNFGELCNSYSSGCPFRMLCDAPDDLTETLISQYYKQRVWNPLDRDGGGNEV